MVENGYCVKMKNYKKSIVTLIFSSLLSTPIFSSPTLKIGTTGDYPPFTSYNEKTKEFSGSDIEMAKSFGKFSKRKIEFVKTSWPTLSKDLRENKFDIAMSGISASEERRKDFLLSNPVISDGKTPLIRCEDKGKYLSLEEINRPSVKVVENIGGTNQKFAEKNLKNATLILVKENSLTIDYLLQKKADLMITDRTEAVYRQKTVPHLCAANPELLFTHDHKIYMVRKSNDALLKEINTWLLEVGQ